MNIIILSLNMKILNSNVDMPLSSLFITIFIFIFAIIIHELGHIITATYYNSLQSIKFTTSSIDVKYSNTMNNENNKILLVGILFGFIAIVIYSYYINIIYGVNGFVIGILLTFIYLCGCLHDFQHFR